MKKSSIRIDRFSCYTSERKEVLTVICREKLHINVCDVGYDFFEIPCYFDDIPRCRCVVTLSFSFDEVDNISVIGSCGNCNIFCVVADKRKRYRWDFKCVTNA